MDLKESIELENHKAELARRLMVETENFKSVILTGQSALKSAILINGGAAVALLAFIGHVWKPDYLRTASINLVGSLQWFVFGVLSAAIAAGGTYAAQFILCSVPRLTRKEGFQSRPGFARPGSFTCRGLLCDVFLRYFCRFKCNGKLPGGPLSANPNRNRSLLSFPSPHKIGLLGNISNIQKSQIRDSSGGTVKKAEDPW